MLSNSSFLNKRLILSLLLIMNLFGASIVLSADAEPLAHADAEYSTGLDWYIKGDYQAAQQSWLRSAKNNNPRAMFNLALLHDEAKIPSANPQKAEQWYKLASQYGYVPADYHYAKRLLANGASFTEAEPYLVRAEQKDYYPAKAMLAKLKGKAVEAPSETTFTEPSATKTVVNKPVIKQPVINKPVVTSSDNKSVPVTPKANNKTNVASKKYLSNGWINSQDDSDWTIQMLAFSQEQRVRAYIDQHGLQNKAAYFVENTVKGPLYKLVYGAYKTKAEANSARAALPAELTQQGPWLRSIASVKAVIAK